MRLATKPTGTSPLSQAEEVHFSQRKKVQPRPRVWRVPMAAGRAYLDTVVIHFTTLPATIAELVERIVAGVKRSRVVFDHVEANNSWLLYLHQPTLEELQRLGRLQRDCTGAPHYATLSRFDIATDFKPRPGETLESVRAWLERCITVRGRKTQTTLDWEGTYYSGDFRSATLMALYHDAMSKLDGQPCVHVDIRIQRARNVKLAGFSYADELVDLDPSKFMERHILLVNHNVLEKITNKLVALNRQVKSAFGPPADPFGDEYVRDWVERLELRRAQTLKDFYPKRFEKLSQIPVAALGLPQRLEWGAIKRQRHIKKTTKGMLWL